MLVGLIVVVLLSATADGVGLAISPVDCAPGEAEGVGAVIPKPDAAVATQLALRPDRADVTAVFVSEACSLCRRSAQSSRPRLVCAQVTFLALVGCADLSFFDLAYSSEG